MKSSRRQRLPAVVMFFPLLLSGLLLAGQTVMAQGSTKPQQPKPAQNPFETVPAVPKQAQPAPKAPTPFEKPKQATPAKPGGFQNVIEAIEFRGARRIPQDTLRAMIFTKKGDQFNIESLDRDFMALWNTGRFNDITLEKERGKHGWIIRFRVVERRVIRSIKYDGLKSIQLSDVLDRFKERHVGLVVETQYDPNKIQRAVVVLKDFLAERGRQFATVTPEIQQIPPSSLAITFKVDEGPKVKVGKITIVGNQVFSDRQVIRAMANLKPIGIPHSILFENLFAKAFDSTKLEEDEERIRNFYQERGYFTAKTLGAKVTMRDVGGGKFRIPLFYPNKPGKRADISITVEEGRRYHLNKITFEGVKLFRTPSTLMRPLFGMQKGDIFSTKKLRKGLDNMRKLYGEFGYIDFVPEPSFEPVPGTDKLNLTITADEGSQFFVRRIDFSGNTTTRDKVIRRELLIDEGDMFNTRLWDLSILRLNQLGYFEKLKKDEAADIHRNPKSHTVDITLHVKERGKNSIQMTGGVSGIAGTFLGFGYATNNFLGLGETLSVSAQLGTRMQNVTFGFTEPYLFDRPIQAGFTVFTTRFNYDQGRETSLLLGRNLNPIFNAMGSRNLLNYVSRGWGFTTFASYPLRRSFARVSLTYGFSNQDVDPLTDSAKAYFRYINFEGLGGPNSLVGISTSRIVPAYNYNTVDQPITPSRGKSLYLSTSFAGIGGNVKMIAPTVDFKYFHRALKRSHVVGFHLLGRLVTGYGGIAPPPFNRFFMGGENDIRGFQEWSISPVAWIPSSSRVPILNSDGSARMQRTIVKGQNGAPDTVKLLPVTQDIPTYQMLFPGGDTQMVGNFEYRIPLVGPVTLALFFDAGIDRIIFPHQLTINPGRLAELNGQFPQAAFGRQAIIDSNTQKIRTSTGIEFQIMMPVVNAPFRLYWAYNPNLVRTFVQPPLVTDRSYFPNQASFLTSVALFGRGFPYWERRKTFRFTVSRTF